MTNLSPKIPKDFYCNKCDYSSCNKKDYTKHLTTRKHKYNDKMMTNNYQELNKEPKTYFCQCGKIYKHRQGLHFHKKTCNCKAQVIQNTDINSQFQIILELIKDNKDIKDFLIEQNKQVIELAKLAGSHNTTNSHNKFNINMFLNEKCKDAINISDFVSQLKIEINDLEETGRIGFADGISKIFINGLNQLEYYYRPIHCNDSKREILYIKDSDKWTKEEPDNPILTKAIKEVAYKNMKQISEWQKLHSNYNDPTSKENDKYLQIVCESMSGSSKEESDKNYNKIIRKLAKETTIPDDIK